MPSESAATETAAGVLRAMYKQWVPQRLRESIWTTRRAWMQRWPGRPPPADTNPDLIWQRLEAIKGVYAGRRCFIMGNGPSLNQMDLRAFEKEYVWGLNRCYLLFDRITWRPAFYVSVDTRVLPDIASDVNRLMSSLRGTKFFFPASFRHRRVLKYRPNVYWYTEIAPKDFDDAEQAFSLDVAHGVSTVRTVTVAALQLAVHLGFNPIYLFGCDTSYVVPQTVDREEGDSDKLQSTQDDDRNHFDPRYFGKGSKWHEPHADRMLAHFAVAKRVCDREGVKIYNATVGGQLEVFPRVDYRDLFL